MPDVFTPAKRSEVMSRIRSTGNAATELRLRALLRAEGITGWRRHLSLSMTVIVPQAKGRAHAKAGTQTKSESEPKAGAQARSKTKTQRGTTPAAKSVKAKLRKPRVRPDFVFRQERVVIFVDGCFWHGCPRHGTRPRQNRKFWDEKIARNRKRDRLVTRELRQSGWTVLRLWECALTRKQQARTLGRLKRALALP